MSSQYERMENGLIYDPTKPAHDERTRISEYLMDAVTEIGRGLPKHTVVPFENVAKDKYPENI